MADDRDQDGEEQTQYGGTQNEEPTTGLDDDADGNEESDAGE
ncbi:hypothetical protein [Natrinema halophilum]|nr:hypothetical protein [Natrinema halophilum]